MTALASEVDWILGHVLGKSRSDLILLQTETVSAEQVDVFTDLVHRRARSEPLAYLLGEQEFCSYSFEVNSSVLIPRPETELIVERSLLYFDELLRDYTVIDIGTGSGAILIALALKLREQFGEEFLKHGTFRGLDLSESALAIARQNAKRHAVERHLSFIRSDLTEGIHFPTERSLELVLTNPPYVADGEELPEDVARYEPELALRGGVEGTSIIEQILSELRPRWREGFVLLMEIGEGQATSVETLVKKLGYGPAVFHEDQQNIPRILELASAVPRRKRPPQRRV